MQRVTFLDRTIAPAGLAGRITNRSWLGRYVRASAITMEGFLWDSDELPTPPDDGRAYVVFPLTGPVQLVARDTIVSTRHGVLFESAHASFGERHVITAPHRALALRVDASLVAHRSAPLVFPAPSVVADVHAAIARGDPPSLGPLGRALRSLGILVAEELERAPVASPGDSRTARALSRALSPSAERPTLVDVESGGLEWSSRHVRRRIDDFLARHHMPFSHWRELRQSYVLTSAVLGLSLHGARLERVARAVGFSSPTSLCHALERNGLSSPGHIAREAARMRARYAA